MEILNYYETLSDIQKLKWREKQGNICYREWFDTLHDEYTLEESGAILLALMFYDGTGGTKPLPKDLADMIDKDRATRSIFRTYMEKTAAGTRDWINKHKLKYVPEKEVEKNSEDIPTQPSQTECIDEEEYIEYSLKTGPNELDYVMVKFLCEEKNKANLPTLDALVDLVEYFDISNVLDFVTRGNQDKWKLNYKEYV